MPSGSTATYERADSGCVFAYGAHAVIVGAVNLDSGEANPASGGR
jgi:hypothetical protein